MPVLVGHVLRFEPRYALVRAAIEAGEIGDVLAAQGEVQSETVYGDLAH